MRQRGTRGRSWGFIAVIAAVVVMVLPSAALGCVRRKAEALPVSDRPHDDVGGRQLRDRHLRDERGREVRPGGGSCNTSTATATRTFMLVNGVSEYQWKAQLTGLAADTQYCYRVYFGSAQLDLLGTDASPVFRTQIPAGSTAPFKFAVFGDWGKTLAAGNPDQANVIVADRRQRRPLRRHDRRQRLRGRQPEGLRRPLPDRGQHERGLRPRLTGRSPGASLPLFPALGNHDLQQLDAAHELAAGHGRGDLRRALPDRHLLLPNGTTSDRLPERLVRLRRRAGALLRADHGVGRFQRRARPSSSRTTSTTTGRPARRSTSGSRTTSRRTRARLQVRVLRTTRSTRDSSEAGPDTFLQGANSLEGLLSHYDVTVGFNGHSHNYQRNIAPAGGIPDPHHRRRRREPRVDRGHDGCSAIDAVWHRLVQHVQRGQQVRQRADPRHEGPRPPLPARERRRHVRDGHARPTSWAGPSIRSHTTRRPRTPTCR